MKLNFDDFGYQCMTPSVKTCPVRCNGNDVILGLVAFLLHKYLILDKVQKTLVSIFFGTPSFTIGVLCNFFWNLTLNARFCILH